MRQLLFQEQQISVNTDVTSAEGDDPHIRVVCQTGTVQMTQAMLSVKTRCCEEQSSHEGWLSVEELACPKILCIRGAARQCCCSGQDIWMEAGSRVRGSGKGMDQTKGVVDQGKDDGLYAMVTGRARNA